MAGGDGGGIYNSTASSPTVHNCVLWENTDSGGTDESAQIHIDTGSLCVYHSCVQGCWTGCGTSNICVDPLFADADGPDDVVGTADDNLRLLPGSPCIDAGNNAAVPPDVADLDGDGNTTELTPVDLDGNLRFLDDPSTLDTGNSICPIIEMGAYEFVGFELCGIPTITGWGVAAMMLLVATAGTIILRRCTGATV